MGMFDASTTAVSEVIPLITATSTSRCSSREPSPRWCSASSTIRAISASVRPAWPSYLATPASSPVLRTPTSAKRHSSAMPVNRRISAGLSADLKPK
jgi:hypothetical protein